MIDKYYEEGKREEYKFVISNMIKNRYSVDEISKLTDLSKNEVLNYKREIKKDSSSVMGLDEHRELKYNQAFREGCKDKEKQIINNMVKEGYGSNLISKVVGIPLN